MKKTIRIGTRDSQLALWQATHVQEQLQQKGFAAELVHIKSDGDIDLVTPLYAMGVQGVFTKTLDAALLSNRVDIAVHSMKDVPVQLAQGLRQAAVLERASYKDLLVCKEETIPAALGFDVAAQQWLQPQNTPVLSFATSSIRRKAQWLNRYPHHRIENLRGNVNTRLQKLADSDWNGAIFAAAGLERIGLRPAGAVELDWMLPAPSQGAIMIVCREEDGDSFEACHLLNHADTALCTQLEKDFLKMLMGGCSTPISALAQVKNGSVYFEGNILSLDGRQKLETRLEAARDLSAGLGITAAKQLLNRGAAPIIEAIRHAGL
ncbi:hydroxymethylbilane synthase [Sediminibacterium soli]|uniref:hydroxymethylbilane synthase n=1 Tax=Sediminibacterium soli TaxID=2698829 RepID=UPI00137AFE48|nr:hydroxymethylbilane synthase [Sediminibacterium soli]NCI47332.1 hydroxymethylbilane synthase [Sediminibacterium soli]